jgi:beta-barrel assembly-enhancing protease
MNKLKTKRISANIFLVLMFLVAACSAGLNIYSDSDEATLGLQFDKQIKADVKSYPMFKGDASVKDYIDKKIFREVLKSSEVKKGSVYNYQVAIIQDDTTLNAFAVPGGYVYVYTGLLKYIDSDAALAGVLGHEIAHCERRHATQRITKQYGLSMLSSLVLGQNPSETASMVANLFGGLALLANSRSDEDEADQYAFKYLSSTKFYPGSVKFFFEKLRDDGKVSSNSGGVATFFSTHPDPIARISTTEQRLKDAGIQIKTYKATGQGIFKDEYKKNISSKLR